MSLNSVPIDSSNEAFVPISAGGYTHKGRHGQPALVQRKMAESIREGETDVFFLPPFLLLD
jgi:hypothetical protein